MNEKLAKLMNEQINAEFYSAYLYLDFANYFTEHDMPGFAHWYEEQAKEEQEHGMKIYNYLHENNEAVTLEAIAVPDKKFECPVCYVEAALKHEMYVTSLINKLYECALECKDYRAQQFLVWFINEQAEEEVNANEMVAKTKMFDGDAKCMYMLDKELMGR